MPCGLAVSMDRRGCGNAPRGRAAARSLPAGGRASEAVSATTSVSPADPVEAMRELDAAAATAGGALLEDRATASRPEHVELWVGLLLFGRDPGVADQRHGPILARPEALCPLSEVVGKRPFANLSRAGEGRAKPRYRGVSGDQPRSPSACRSVRRAPRMPVPAPSLLTSERLPHDLLSSFGSGLIGSMTS